MELPEQGIARAGDGWCVWSHALCVEALRHSGLSAARFQGWSETGSVLERAYALFGLQMVFTDPPVHTRLRALVTRAFTPRVVEGMRQTIQQTIDTLLCKVPSDAPWDAITTLAYPLPVTVIAEMLGIPSEDRAKFKCWSDDFFVLLEGALPESGDTRLARSLTEFTHYIQARIAPLRQRPREDLLSALVQAQEQGDHLTDQELLANTLLLLAAGHETTTNLIGNGLWLLLTHPTLRAELEADPALWPAAIEEFLRCESPVQWTSRVAKEELMLGTQRIQRGEWVSLELVTANRDPIVFPDPNTPNLHRTDNKHLAFGYGPHYCLGAALARLEAQLALASVLRWFPALALGAPPLWKPSLTFHGLERLLVQ